MFTNLIHLSYSFMKLYKRYRFCVNKITATLSSEEMILMKIVHLEN
jgi:hypothetical protein